MNIFRNDANVRRAVYTVYIDILYFVRFRVSEISNQWQSAPAISYLSVCIEQNYIRMKTLACWVSCTAYGKLNFFSCERVVFPIHIHLLVTCIHWPRRTHQIVCFMLEAQRVFLAGCRHIDEFFFLSWPLL